VGGWSPTGSTQHVGHQPAYCTCPGWLWGWRIWWDDDWQGKPKCSEKNCSSAILSKTNPTSPDQAQTWATAVESQRLSASAMARPSDVTNFYCQLLRAPGPGGQVLHQGLQLMTIFVLKNVGEGVCVYVHPPLSLTMKWSSIRYLKQNTLLSCIV
jgi:hypothetical protein